MPSDPKEAALRRTAAHFSIRCRDDIPLPEMAADVAQALGCRLEPGEYHELSAFTGNLLGMRVGLFGWRGRNDWRIYRFEGDVEDVRFLDAPDGTRAEIVPTDLGPVLADLLCVHTRQHWWLPTDTDHIAEIAYGESLAD